MRPQDLTPPDEAADDLDTAEAEGEGEQSRSPSINRRNFFALSAASLGAAITIGQRRVLTEATSLTGPKPGLHRVVKHNVINRINRLFGSRGAYEEAQKIVGDFLYRRLDWLANLSASDTALKAYVASISREFKTTHVIGELRRIPFENKRIFANVAIIDRQATDILWLNDIFPRIRYRRWAYQHPTPPALLRSWGEPPRAVLFGTTTQINGKLDSETLMLIRREERLAGRPFCLLRSWQFCQPGSFAAELVFSDSFGGDKDVDFPNLGVVRLPPFQVGQLVEARRRLVSGDCSSPFRYSRIDAYKTLGPVCNKIVGESMDGKRLLYVVDWIDSMLERNMVSRGR